MKHRKRAGEKVYLLPEEQAWVRFAMEAAQKMIDLEVPPNVIYAVLVDGHENLWSEEQKKRWEKIIKRYFRSL